MFSFLLAGRASIGASAHGSWSCYMRRCGSNVLFQTFLAWTCHQVTGKTDLRPVSGAVLASHFSVTALVTLVVHMHDGLCPRWTFKTWIVNWRFRCREWSIAESRSTFCWQSNCQSVNRIAFVWFGTRASRFSAPAGGYLVRVASHQVEPVFFS